MESRAPVSEKTEPRNTWLNRLLRKGTTELGCWNNTVPVRSELFGPERLEQHARSLARAHRVSEKGYPGNPLATRLKRNAEFLRNANIVLAQDAETGVQLTPAAEWLIDNYYLVDMQIQEIGVDLPAGYYRELPKLSEGMFARLPRVFDIAWAFVSHTDSHFESESLRRFLLAYQQEQPLMIREVWAVPITLRIVLIENLRRVAESIVRDQEDRQAADKLADRLLALGSNSGSSSMKLLAQINVATLSKAFVVQFAHRLRGQDPQKDPAFLWLETLLRERGRQMDDVVQDELHEQGTLNATIRNIVTSLRLAAALDWSELVERISPVSRILFEYKPFSSMDFITRNLYASSVENLARGSNQTEISIVQKAMEMASSALSLDEKDIRRADPGYYLVGEGRSLLEKELGYVPSARASIGRFCRRAGITGYSTTVTVLALAMLAFFLSTTSDSLSGRAIIGLALLGFIPATDAAVACVNRFAMWAVNVSALPAIELKTGIPEELRTLVVIPTLLTSPASIEELVSRLEMHYLASRDGDVYFALLTDWTDAAAESRDGDAELLDVALEGIARLNRTHGPAAGGNRFTLFHRRRMWNESEGKWIGWERKRGKLHELNRILRGATDTSFIALQGQHLPMNVRYVVTLDSDTRLPHEAVRRLVGKLAHPLNQPKFDPVVGRVVGGYAILQPRVTPSLPAGRRSTIFQRVFSSPNGIDPYTAAVSDLYQDMFAEGSFAGKGIYEIDAFEAALAGRVPESTLLSHDLFEGVFARAGLVTDIEVIEEFPTDYLVAASRQHRWVRGDWQLLPWIFPWVCRIRGVAMSGSPMTGIARWKMMDNLRRSLSAPMAILALFAGWFLNFHDATVWSLFIVSTIALPSLLPLLGDIIPRRQWVNFHSYAAILLDDLRRTVVTTLLCLVFLADQACLMGDAIIRTLGRVFITRRNLLQWTTAAQASEASRPEIEGYYRQMVGTTVIGAVALLWLFLAPYHVWMVVLPFAAMWIAAGLVAWRASQYSVTSRRFEATKDDVRVLRMEARRTWRYFETFVTAEEHDLPPDNFQEDPKPLVARRTSPTNMGLYLLSVVSAYDFGWIGLQDAVTKIEATMKTMEALPKYRGHFHNWYSTADLSSLHPVYVSTVDSGNLAGHLIALASACQYWRTKARDAQGWRDGVEDCLNLALEEVQILGRLQLPEMFNARALSESFRMLLDNTRNTDFSQAELRSRLGVLRQHLEALSVTLTLPSEIPASQEGVLSDLLFWVNAAIHSGESHERDLAPRASAAIDSRLSDLEETSRSMAMAMEFGFLRNSERKLLSIGFVVDEGTLDDNCYDLLASEARLAVFFAIAKGDIPAREWFRLGRPITSVSNGEALVSWSGSMFEYLMPSLVMRAPFGSLLEETGRLIVQRQIEFGVGRGTPWGVSESAYNARDMEYSYQYSNFGVPGLGLKRGLGHEVVVAPYATMLAAMIDPQMAVANLRQLSLEGGQGRYGFYEALDYTPERLPEHQAVAVIRAHMAHHQGMSILAIADTVMDGIMRARFHAEPIIGAAELLLQERAPTAGAVAQPLPGEEKKRTVAPVQFLPGGRHVRVAHDPSPVTHLLSNGRYTVMLTSAGSGYSRWNDQAVTRWREDTTLDNWGSYLYLKDVKTGRIWSAGQQPCGEEAESYDVIFKEDRAEFSRRDGKIVTNMVVLVSAEDDAELRQLAVSNTGSQTTEIDVTSYAELALFPQAADLAHPAFSKFFVQTEYVPELQAIIATRRRRNPTDAEIWAAHLVVTPGTLEIETNRAHFLGRGGDVRNADAIRRTTPLTSSTGTVLDPVFSARCRLVVNPGSTERVSFWTMVASTREALMDAIERHRDAAALDRAVTLAWTQAQVQLRHLNIRPTDADLFQRLAAYLLYASPTLRAAPDRIQRGIAAQQELWGQGISGDLPVLLLVIGETEDFELARLVLRAHEYFRLKLLPVDLIIINEHATSYVQELQHSLEAIVRSSSSAGNDGRGAVHLLRAGLMSDPVRELLFSIARVVLTGKGGRLVDQLNRAEGKLLARSPAHTVRDPYSLAKGNVRPTVPALEFWNGYGGFANDGKEYVVVHENGRLTPLPWINVVANPVFGFQASSDGAGYTWSENSRENQLTPWSNDPVSNPTGEAFYLQDDETREIWSPVASVCHDPAGIYIARHGRGFSSFERIVSEIESTLVQYVPTDDTVKISRLTLHNRSSRPRTLSFTAYVEWVLGPSRTATASFLTTEIDAETNAMFARNRWTQTFGSRVAFADISGKQTSWMDDRTGFVGRHGNLSMPSALSQGGALPGLNGAGMDPCGALKTTVTIPPNGTVELVFLLGQGDSPEQARTLIGRYRTADLDAVLKSVSEHWDRITGAVQVRTPDRSMDIMLNGWLLYQSLSSRIWARAGFYQASGAYGFRDQLQDGMSLTLSAPELVREHLLRAASRQFLEGDFQHWWLPQRGNGVRTLISDDCAWMAYTVAHYVKATGDAAVLDEPVSFLKGAVLAAGEHERFFFPEISDHESPLYDHCALALDYCLRLGAHGLPLMGTGDWNDGMNRVGEAGRGESVWLGWFIHSALMAFIPLAEARQDLQHVREWKAAAAALVVALENAWDGAWYRRAYFDDGSPLGSHENAEARIDAIAQSWSVISAAGDPARARQAMQSVKDYLVRAEDGVILVLTPPFNRSEPDPGYIRGYPPGIRENGGQYTHAAMWTVMATALLGQGDEAHQMFSILNPINHAATSTMAQRYKVEPYVVVADVYSTEPHVGRGGWSWYTGSAGWMQRVGTEAILGIRVENDQLIVAPCLPGGWPGFEARLRWRSNHYLISVKRSSNVGMGTQSMRLDEHEISSNNTVQLVEDGLEHRLEVILAV
ncbi:glycosyl transferase [Gluconobacter wancherniae]|uniref:GH36-type glycosyl hydrolase domain-containing protein n=1 Tax=Gluconobacter wancherniae TaxID=1307955 RepID=UPI001B8AB998|nr:glucoamylase family protein [Gluconobacter wancherniae]MBS1061518.1 glycosyl transferase [Gluconobacter wancherniae]